jgi:hypothetical protein
MIRDVVELSFKLDCTRHVFTPELLPLIYGDCEINLQESQLGYR